MINPTESIFVTSSYVNVPPIDTSPSTCNPRALIELIPDIFVALSPIIFPFAFILFVTVNEFRRVAAYGLSITFEFVMIALPINP